MAYDQPSSTDETDYFLEYLLRCALTAPGAETSPTAGRILARLLVVGAVEYGDDLVTPYLVPVPGDDAVFEVRAYQPGDLVPTDVREDLPASAALKIALRSARESDDGIEVVSRNAAGVERCVLVRDSTGDFEFRFAGPETLVGEADQCAAARTEWAATLARWRAATPVAAAAGGKVRGTVAAAPRATGAPVSSDDRSVGAGGGTEAPSTGGGWWVAPGDEPPAQPAGSGPATAGSGEVFGAGDLERAPSASGGGGLAASRREHAAAAVEGGLPAHTGDGPERQLVAGAGDAAAADDRSPAALAHQGGPAIVGEERLAAAVREAIANLVVEVDLSQVEQLLRRVLEDDHREMVEPLARRLSARLGEALDRPDPAAFAQVLAQVVPNPVDLADAVAADVGALLSETILRRRAGDSGTGVEAFSLLAGIEQLQVRLDGLHDQLQRSAGLLEAMTGHLEAGDRRAAIAERVATSVDQEMQRLANRIDEQVAALAASSAAGGSDAVDGVARLTRKLRQSVVQFDRVLERMDAAFELPPPSEEDQEEADDEPPPERPDLRPPRDRDQRLDRPPARPQSRARRNLR